jgi:hypothetical protein
MLIDTVFIELALYLSCIITGFKAVTAAVQRQMIYLKVHPLPVPDHPRGLRNSVALDPQARLVVINALTCLSRHRLYDIMLNQEKDKHPDKHHDQPVCFSLPLTLLVT